MDNNLKNMIVLKDLPSNIVDEAIVILKPNAKIKNVDFSMNNQTSKDKVTKSTGKYIINEAELIVANYISGLENKKDTKNQTDMLKKYKSMKLTVAILVFILFVNILFL